ncbi:UDP-glucuronosyltransferase 2B31-like isoform X1 [Pteronotus mesoamericanus]|uniref:UDP-glucuronosyltransferase 2B31-like isoform X1 n=1 Tax=Pteronotus mesoamericanus TaxID=1884717 RepID=UPI0023EC7E24|nr:UDP-glucuronosyltransferase 2B31-like isoform X1 [Pteronotus parnellii mesoamericanus]
MSVKWIPVLLLLEQLSFQFSPGRCGRVLVWPTEYSHWMNMKIILDELVQRGHEVIVLASTASILVDPNEPSALQFEIFSTPFTKDDMKFFYRKTISKWTNDISKDTFWTYYSRVQEMLWEGYDILAKLCRDVVFNRRVMTKLQHAKFDVLLADAVGPCGELLAELLQVPLVYSVRFSPGYKTERYSGGLPFLPSYVPVIFSELSDQMTFKERVKNMLYALYFDFWFQTFNQKKWDRFYTDALGYFTEESEVHSNVK